MRTILKILDKQNLRTVIDSISFRMLFIYWVILIMAFGMVYNFASDDNSYLRYTQERITVNSIADSVYFSFITATTTGFGDIVPVGNFKTLAISEVLLALLLLALVTSKLVSLKQDIILSEVYDISFSERIYRLRSSMIVFRQHIERMISNIDEGKIRKKEIQNMHTSFSLFDDTLREAVSLTKKKKNHFVKDIDDVNAELILSGAMNTLEKVDELIRDIEKHNIEWKSDCNVKCLLKSLEMTRKLIDVMNLDDRNLSDDMEKWFEDVSGSIKKDIGNRKVSRIRKC